jgi:hypothetical protein
MEVVPLEKSPPESASRSWFCVFPNPLDHGFSGAPQEICDAMVEIWLRDNPQRAAAVLYCVAADGLHHLHAVLEDTKVLRFSAVKKLYPSMHIDPTRGSKEQAEDYINKRGKFEEKGEQILAKAQHGEIKGCQGQRRDIEIIDDMIAGGKTPAEILALSFGFYRYESMIKKSYFAKRDAETPIMRDVRVFWHVGESGAGKSYERVKLSEQHGEGSVYCMTDYEVGGFDSYNGEPILFMDEFRGQLKFSVLLHVLDKYKASFHARYSNIKGLWSEVHISSVLPPERVYAKMVTEIQDLDVYEQLRRRITQIVYHYIDIDGKYRQYEMPMNEYAGYEMLKNAAESA